MEQDLVLKKNLSIYRNEIWAITKSIIRLEESLFQCKCVISCSDESKMVLDPDTEPHEIISSILNNASRLNKLFFVASQRQKESNSDYKFRKERGDLVRKFFLGQQKDYKELFKSKARNSIEHFDERVDKLMNALIEDLPDLKNKQILYNFTTNFKDNFKNWNSILPVKVLVTETWEYFMLNPQFESEIVNLKSLFEENRKIIQLVVEYVNENFVEDADEKLGPLGMIIPTK